MIKWNRFEFKGYLLFRFIGVKYELGFEELNDYCNENDMLIGVMRIIG